MTTVWREAMNIGDEEIDNDHKDLIALADQLVAVAKKKVERDSVEHTLFEFVKLTKHHFHREEKIQKEINYPYQVQHLRSHQAAIKRLSSWLEKYEKCTTDDERDAIVIECIAYTNEWLMDHILEQDMQMKPYVMKAKGKVQD